MSDLFGAGGRRFLVEGSLPPLSRNRITSCLRLIDALTGELDSVEQEMRVVFRDHPALPRLMRIPGIGFIAAATVIAEVWDVSRFRHAEQLCSWAGLTPTERSSAGHTRRGHISAVLLFLADGLSNQEITERLFISFHTLRNHIQNIISKLGAHSKLEAVSIAIREGLITTQAVER